MDGHNSIKSGFYYKQVVRASFGRPLCKAALGGKKNTIGRRPCKKTKVNTDARLTTGTIRTLFQERCQL